MEKEAKLSFNYYQIPSLSVPLRMLNCVDLDQIGLHKQCRLAE